MRNLSILLFAAFISSLIFFLSCTNSNFTSSNNSKNKSDDQNQDSADYDSAETSEPTDITGAWLTCNPNDQPINNIGCSYRNQDGSKYSQKIDKWNLSIVDQNSSEHKISDLVEAPIDSYWHVLFKYEQALLDNAKISATLTINGEEKQKQTVLLASSDIDRIRSYMISCEKSPGSGTISFGCYVMDESGNKYIGTPSNWLVSLETTKESAEAHKRSYPVNDISTSSSDKYHVQFKADSTVATGGLIDVSAAVKGIRFGSIIGY